MSKQSRTIESLESVIDTSRACYKATYSHKIAGTNTHVIHVEYGVLGLCSAYVGPKGELTVRDTHNNDHNGKNARIVWNIEVGSL